LPDDVVFTVEYSIRSAQAAVYALLGLKREPPAVYMGKFDPRVLYKAFMALHDPICQGSFLPNPRMESPVGGGRPGRA
jgi:myosin-crossreactive antigen